MFERYTDPARRVIFFARYEASQFGSATIETEHILLGLLREDEKGLKNFFSDPASLAAVRGQIADSLPVHEKTSTSIDIPLSEECIRILSHSAEESKGLGHLFIDTNHLLLGILSEEHCSAAKTLKGFGLDLALVREKIRRLPAPHPGIIQRFMDNATSPLPAAGVVPDDETAKRIAEAVWFPRFPAEPGDQITAQSATLTGGVWIVTGFQRGNLTNTALSAFIQKEDGKILRLHMEKLDS